jgi:hypothetical protein
MDPFETISTIYPAARRKPSPDELINRILRALQITQVGQLGRKPVAEARERAGKKPRVYPLRYIEDFCPPSLVDHPPGLPVDGLPGLFEALSGLRTTFWAFRHRLEMSDLAVPSREMADLSPGMEEGSANGR